MARESRVQKSLLNARVNLFCYVLSLIVAFFTRKAFLDQLGTDFIGLTGTLQSILGFLNLAELGVGTAIGYVLYKPLFDDDKIKINEIVSVFGYIYRCIGTFILVIGILLSFFLPFIFPSTVFCYEVIYLGYYAFLLSSLITYFFNYKMTLLSADQRNYEVMGYYQIVISSKMCLQMIFAFYVKSFYLFLLLEIIFGVLYSVILNIRISKVYPWLDSDIKLGRKLFKKYPEINKYVRQLFFHKLGGFVQYQIAPFFVYTFVSLPVVALYSNYTLITLKIQGLMAGVLDSTGAGVGNLISENDKQKIYSVYKELLSVRILIAGILTICLFVLINPFIILWLGENYVLSRLVTTLISFQTFLALTRGTTEQFLYGYGLFYDVWAPVAECTIFIICSIIGGYFWGLPGVLMGPILSTVVIIHIWKPIFLYIKGFKRSFGLYIKLCIINLIPIVVAFAFTMYLFPLISNCLSLSLSWRNWFLGSVLFITLMGVLSLTFGMIVSASLRAFFFRLIKKKRNRCF